MYDYAEQLIRMGKAYVDDLTADQIREYRGTLTEPGRDSPYRNRPVDENLDLFRRMKAGEFPDGSTRAAREDRHGVAEHQHARPHAVPDSPREPPPHRRRVVASTRCTTTRTRSRTRIEGITHSLCTLEFEDHRPFYDWVIESLADAVVARSRSSSRG